MDYHLFKKTVIGRNNKQIKRWYYWFYDAQGKQIKKHYSDCMTKIDTEEFVKALPPLEVVQKQKTIAQVAQYMFIPGSEHYKRCTQFNPANSSPNIIVEMYIFSDSTIPSNTFLFPDNNSL